MLQLMLLVLLLPLVVLLKRLRRRHSDRLLPRIPRSPRQLRRRTAHRHSLVEPPRLRRADGPAWTLDGPEDGQVWTLDVQAGGRDGRGAPAWIAVTEPARGVSTAVLGEPPCHWEAAAARDWLREAVFPGVEETHLF